MIRDFGMPRERRKCLMSLAVSAAATSLPEPTGTVMVSTGEALLS